MRQIVSVIFFTVVISTFALGHRYLWQRLVRDTQLPKPLHKILTGLFILGFISIPIVMATAKVVPRATVSLLAMPAFFWFGIVAYLMMFVLILEGARWAYKKRTKAVTPEEDASTDSPEDVSRRLFLSRTMASTAVAGTTSFVAYGAYEALGDVHTPVVEIKLQRLPKALTGYKIAMMSDIHIGALLGPDFINYLVEKCNALKPDMVVITGDLVDGTVKNIGKDIALLAKLKSRHGTFFVTGNHEYYSGGKEWVAFLRKIGMKVLINERVSVGEPGHSFDLVGIPDDRAGWFYADHTPDLAKAVAGRDPERELVMLAHRPTAMRWAENHGVGLQLSGHTHGGQFFPLRPIMQVYFDYVAGHYFHNDLTQIYVSRGTGFWGPPIRVGSPPEITTLVLTS